MTNPGETFPSSWRDTPKLRGQWDKLSANSDYLRQQQAERGSLTCEYCDKGPLKVYHWSESRGHSHASLSDMATVDHVVPRSRGGSNDKGNLAVSCQPCKASKDDSCVLM